MEPDTTGLPEAGYAPMQQFAGPAGDVRDPYPMFAELRATCPVMEVSYKTTMARRDEKAPKPPLIFSVFRHEYVREVLADPKRFSSDGYAISMGHVMGKTILQMDPPEHLRHRALVAKAFRPRVLEKWNDELIAATVTELIDGFAADGHADLVPQLTFPFPVQVIARILGLPRTDWPHFQKLSTELIGVMQSWERGLAASRELRSYLAEIIADRRRQPMDDLVSELVVAEVDGQRLADDEIYPFLLLLLPAGVETTYRSSGSLLFGLLSHPKWLDGVRADRDLLPQAIEEGLRWEPPVVNVMRVAAEDVELGGVHIPQGALVVLSLGAANRDPASFAGPDDFDIFRDAKQHVAFGDGPHMCLGMHLARLESRVMLNAVLDRLPNLRLDPAAPDPHVHGLVFRSPPSLPVLFDPVRVEPATPPRRGRRLTRRGVPW
jgi:cytochrome P450